MPRFHKLPPYTALRKTLRNTSTDAERKLWQCLRGRRFHNLKFRRQYGINRYILDFYCPRLHLAIEIDGGQHFNSDHHERDIMRTQDLISYGIRVVRFTNNDVLKNIDGILEVLEVLVLHPKTPPQT